MGTLRSAKPPRVGSTPTSASIMRSHSSAEEREISKLMAGGSNPSGTANNEDARLIRANGTLG